MKRDAKRRVMLRSRDLALVSGFTAILVSYGYVSSTLFRTVTRSTDLFFLIPTLFVIITLTEQRIGMASLVGTIAGIVYLAIPGAPLPIHIGAASISNGVAFDIYLRASGGITPNSRRRIVAAGALGNAVMAIVVLALFQVTGFLTLSPSLAGGAIILDTAVGAAGALFGLNITQRLRTAEIARSLPAD